MGLLKFQNSEVSAGEKELINHLQKASWLYSINRKQARVGGVEVVKHCRYGSLKMRGRSDCQCFKPMQRLRMNKT